MADTKTDLRTRAVYASYIGRRIGDRSSGARAKENWRKKHISANLSTVKAAAIEKTSTTTFTIAALIFGSVILRIVILLAYFSSEG